MGCCNRGKCGEKECTCDRGWYGPACNLDLEAYRMFASLAKQKSAEISEAMKDKLAEAAKTKEIIDVLTKIGPSDSNAPSKIRALEKDLEELDVAVQDLKERAARTSISSVARSLDAALATCSRAESGLRVETDMETTTKTPSTEDIGKMNMALSRMKSANTPTTDDFGIGELTEQGHVGSIPVECKDNCNSKGYCEKGICYCQPGNFGKTCNEVQKAGPVSLGQMGAFLGGSLLVAAIMTLCVLSYFARQKRKKEREMGYLV